MSHTLHLPFYQEEISHYRSALSVVEPGAKLLSVIARFDEAGPVPGECVQPSLAAQEDRFFGYAYRMQLNFAGAFAVIDHSAFFAGLYTHPGKQPLSVRLTYAAISEPGDALPIACRVIAGKPEPRVLGHCRDVEHCYWRNWRRDFDYLLLIDPEAYGYRPTAPYLELLHDERFFRLYRIRASD